MKQSPGACLWLWLVDSGKANWVAQLKWHRWFQDEFVRNVLILQPVIAYNLCEVLIPFSPEKLFYACIAESSIHYNIHRSGYVKN
ncbi:hypothetical protein BKA69DRAFT_1054938 [Paraphysoderma sedebokerense]|nr:hypothetical protein BKA69DRAFT_1058440 [Paraphysoderma sedebokerense]KAI9144417.1 hypothetical protein BKA69DRAFT_1054938 [Paraphysoderma sedebokerense]